MRAGRGALECPKLSAGQMFPCARVEGVSALVGGDEHLQGRPGQQGEVFIFAKHDECAAKTPLLRNLVLDSIFFSLGHDGIDDSDE